MTFSSFFLKDNREEKMKHKAFCTWKPLSHFSLGRHVDTEKSDFYVWTFICTYAPLLYHFLLTKSNPTHPPLSPREEPVLNPRGRRYYVVFEVKRCKGIESKSSRCRLPIQGGKEVRAAPTCLNFIFFHFPVRESESFSTECILDLAKD